MIQQKLRRAGNSYIVTIPREEVERLGLHEGQLLAVEVRPVEIRPALASDVQAASEASWQRNEAAYRHLADH